MEEERNMEIENAIAHAKKMTPQIYNTRIKLLSRREMDDIEKTCQVRCTAVYMDGTAMYAFKYLEK